MRAGQCHGVEAVISALTRVEPDFGAGRRPGQVDEVARPSFGDFGFGPLQVEHGDRPIAPQSQRAFGEGDEVAFAGDAKRADQLRRLVEEFSRGEFQPISSGLRPDDRQTRSVGSPVRQLNASQCVAGRAARQRRSREGSQFPSPLQDRTRLHEQRHLASRRDGEDVGVLNAERARIGAIGPRREQLNGLPVPGGAVDDRPAFWCESRRQHGAAGKRQSMQRGQRWLTESATRQEGGGDHTQQGDARGQTDPRPLQA